MNKWCGIGRLTKDIELKHAQGNGKAVARFTLAVNRDFKNAKGEYEADFINCIAFDKRAETLANYVSKGHRLAVTGKIQTGSYQNKEGQKVYTTDIIVDGFDFLQNKGESQSGSSNENPYYDYEEVDVGEVPF